MNEKKFPRIYANVEQAADRFSLSVAYRKSADLESVGFIFVGEVSDIMEARKVTHRLANEHGVGEDETDIDYEVDIPKDQHQS